MAKSKPLARKAVSKPEAAARRVNQTDFPATSLQDAQRIAAGLIGEFGGQPTSPPDVALAIDISPTSSAWRVLCSSSIAYGLTDGGWNAARISLMELGRRLVAPEAEGDDLAARREAILQPSLMREFFERYRRAKFPSDPVAANVLRGLGLPADRLASAVQILKHNGRHAGVARDTPNGLFVNLDSATVPPPATTGGAPTIVDGEGEESPSLVVPGTASALVPTVAPLAVVSRVFISHGKQKAIVAQIKELLAFGKFEPIVSVERESTAIPVPEKVFEDMRSCSAGVLHVTSEGEYLDRDGNPHRRINDNVLIEIGAAMALYGKKIVLLVEKDIPLPSNLQGLYRCEYEGDKLDYDATMKLLKTFSQFR